jgi:hypothetical protein
MKIIFFYCIVLFLFIGPINGKDAGQLDSLINKCLEDYIVYNIIVDE